MNKFESNWMDWNWTDKAEREPFWPNKNDTGEM